MKEFFVKMKAKKEALNYKIASKLIGNQKGEISSWLTVVILCAIAVAIGIILFALFRDQITGFVTRFFNSIQNDIF